MLWNKVQHHDVKNVNIFLCLALFTSYFSRVSEYNIHDGYRFIFRNLASQNSAYLLFFKTTNKDDNIWALIPLIYLSPLIFQYLAQFGSCKVRLCWSQGCEQDGGWQVDAALPWIVIPPSPPLHSTSPSAAKARPGCKAWLCFALVWLCPLALLRSIWPILKWLLAAYWYFMFFFLETTIKPPPAYICLLDRGIMLHCFLLTGRELAMLKVKSWIGIDSTSHLEIK